MYFAGARHACDQGDGLDQYTWTQFDAREGGIQVLKDSQNNVKITTELLKVDGGENGGSWAARIIGEPINRGSDISAFISILCSLFLLYRTAFTHFFHFLRRVGRDGGARPRDG
jgi:Glycosyl hydrolase family 63 N-terminal domain